MPVLAAEGSLEVPLALARHLLEDDVDTACHRLVAAVRRGGAGDLEALDQIGGQAVQGKALGRRFAVEEDLRVAVAEAAHADLATAARHAFDGDAGHPLEGIGNAGVSVTDQLVLADDDLRSRGRAPVVLRIGGRDHHGLQFVCRPVVGSRLVLGPGGGGRDEGGKQRGRQGRESTGFGHGRRAGCAGSPHIA